MRVTAAELARSTHVLLIGVGEYATPSMYPLTAGDDVDRLKAALVDSAAAGVPEAHVHTLVNAQATKARVKDAVRELGAAVNEAAILLIYFSGHGHRLDDQFFFHLFDSDPKALSSTALSAADLTACLDGTPARGVLVIVDCCVGAGFAETAPRFFYDLGSRDFRIALAASRATEPSWEAPGQGGSLFTKHLVRILNGDTASGSQPGEITYLGLVEALSFAINEDLTLLRPDHPRQELVANGSTVADPLLFVCARAAMDGLTVQTGRVSREHLRRVLRRAAAGTLIGLLVLMGIYCGWMSAHQYAVADAEGTTIWRGHPRMSGFGYPVRDVRLPYPLRDYSPTSTLGRKQPLTVFGSRDVMLDGIEDSLSIPVRAARLARVGRREAAEKLLARALSAPPGTLTYVQTLRAQELRIRLAPHGWLPQLLRTVKNEPTSRQIPAVLAILDLAPSDGLRYLGDNSDEEGIRWAQPAALDLLEPPCSADEARYLRMLSESHQASTFGGHILLTWRRLGCGARSTDVANLVARFRIEGVESVGTWARLVGFARPEEIMQLSYLDSDRRESFALGYGMGCPIAQAGEIADASTFARVQFIRRALRECADSMLKVNQAARNLKIGLLVGGVDVQEAFVDLPEPSESYDLSDTVTVRSGLRLLQEAKAKGAEEYVLDQALHGDVSYVAPAAIRAAERLGIPWRSDRPFARDDQVAFNSSYQVEYLRWMHASDPQSADLRALQGLGDRYRSSVDDYFGQVGLADGDLKRLRSILDEAVDQRTEPAAQLVVMYGDTQDLTRVLESAEPEIRGALYTHGAFNPHFVSWLAQQNARWPVFDASKLEPALRYLARVDNQSRSLKGRDRCWLQDLEYHKGEFVGPLGDLEVPPPAVTARLAKLLDECEAMPLPGL